MEKIIGQEFIGERPLYCRHGLYLENVKIHRGESALKETSDITAVSCVFEGKYPFWCCENFIVRNCLFTGGARAALWYSKNVEMTDTYVDAPKMFREMDGIKLKNVQIPGAAETLWHCKDIELDNVSADHADYIFMHCSDIKIRNFRLDGNYSFQYCKNVEIHDSILNTKDAFWETENVTVYDSEIKRRISRMVCQESPTGKMPHFRHTAAVLCRKPHNGRLHHGTGRRPRVRIQFCQCRCQRAHHISEEPAYRTHHR